MTALCEHTRLLTRLAWSALPEAQPAPRVHSSNVTGQWQDEKEEGQKGTQASVKATGYTEFGGRRKYYRTGIRRLMTIR